MSSTSPLLYSGSLPVQFSMPSDGFPFDPTAYIALPAIGVTSAVVSFPVPDGYHGIIKSMGNVYVGTGFVEGSGSLIWQLLANNGVIRNYDNILASLGLVSAPQPLGSVNGGVFVFEGQVVTLQLNNVSLAVGGATVGGRLSGWFFPKWRMPDEASIF